MFAAQATRSGSPASNARSDWARVLRRPRGLSADGTSVRVMCMVACRCAAPSGALDGKGDDIVDAPAPRRDHHDAIEAERHAGAGRQARRESRRGRTGRPRGRAGRAARAPRGRPRIDAPVPRRQPSSWKPLASSSSPQNASNREATGPRTCASAACDAGKSCRNVMRVRREASPRRASPSRGRAARRARRRPIPARRCRRARQRVEQLRRSATASGSRPSASLERVA